MLERHGPAGEDLASGRGVPDPRSPRRRHRPSCLRPGVRESLLADPGRRWTRVFTESRCRFVGKCSPVQFFWGSFDLAVTRFSGRPAPPREGPAFMQEAYSHEVISHGFWPGSGPMMEPAFYAYAVPEPDGLKGARVSPAAAYYHRELNEFILPYEAVRRGGLAGAHDRRVHPEHLRAGGHARQVGSSHARAS